MAEQAISTEANQAGFRPASSDGRSASGLDAVNFLLADVRGTSGPYLNVFLVMQQHWSQTEVGWVTTVGGLFGFVAQTPIGAPIDEDRARPRQWDRAGRGRNRAVRLRRAAAIGPW
jgi:hypothetical protein